MKKTLLFSIVSIMVMAFTACGPTKEEAITFNDKIINEQVLIIEKINLLYDALEKYEDHNGMDFAYSEALKQLETGTNVVSKLEKFGGSNDFRDGALQLFEIYKSVLQNEFKRMIDLSKLPDEQYTSEQEDEYKMLHQVVSKKMDDGLKDLNEIQREFAAKYKFEIEKKK